MALVVLRRYLTLSEAYAAAGALTSAGLHPTVMDVEYGSVVWTEQYYLGGFRLALPGAEAKEAVEVLREAYTPTAADEGEDEEPAGAPPRLPLPPVVWALLAFVGGWSVAAYRLRPTPFRLAYMTLCVTSVLVGIWLIWPRGSG